LLKPARASFDDVAPTVIAEGAKAGEKPHASLRLLPDATEIVTPLLMAFAKVVSMDCMTPLPPKLADQIAGFFPLAATQSTLLMMPEKDPLPLSPSTLTA